MNRDPRRPSGLPRRLLVSSLPLAVATSLACGGDDDGRPPVEQPTTVEETLEAFGVDLVPTPRVDDDQDPLPEDYSPFGSAMAVDAIDEIALLGVPLAPSFGLDGAAHLVELVPDAANDFDASVLGSPAPEMTPWALSEGEAPGLVRDAAALDADGDGKEEVVVVSARVGVGPVELRVLEDGMSAFSPGATATVLERAPLDLVVEAGDFDGDGRGDVVVGLVFEDRVDVVSLENDGQGGFSAGTMGVTVPRVSPDGVLSASIATGNLDYDNPWELAVVVDERFERGGRETGSTRFFVYDDQVRGYAERARDRAVRVDGETTTRTAITATVAAGDLDADGVDELVFGGLSSFPDAGCTYEYVMLSLDDLKRELAPLGGSVFERTPFGSCNGGALRTVQVGTFDVDADGGIEVHANGLVFDDFRASTPFTVVAELPWDAMFAGDDETGFEGRADRDNLVFATGDVSQDQQQDLVVVSQATGSVRVWGLDMIDGWSEIARVPLGPLSPDVPARPILLTPNADEDSLALDYSEGDYRLVFTEPILIAALAAPPCDAALGQNLDACRTAFGTAESDTVEEDVTWTLSVGGIIGFSKAISAFGVQVEAFEVVASVKRNWEWKTTTSYTTTKRVVYETGANEDGVIFTTIPLDQYTYTILSHPEPELVGEEIVVSLPREPVQILVDREFYNQNVIEGGIRIDDAILRHRPGDIDSYPTVADKDQLLTDFEGLETRQVDVGQGGGSVGVGINVFEETGSARGYGVEAELEVKATIGVVVFGVTVGGGRDRSISISHGEESEYTGSVANMSADAFATDAYSFGMFTYVHDASPTGQEFEVINYWVD